MQSTEKSAKNVNEAIELALAELGAAREQVAVEVLNGGRSGILGLGAEEARVRVTLLEEKTAAGTPPADVETAAREVLENLLGPLGYETTVEVRSLSDYGIAEGQASCVLDIQGTDPGVLIGRRGKTLFALQYLANLILSKRYRSRVKIFVDVEGYRRRRQESLSALALRMADQVRSTGQVVTLEAMPPHERRIIHLALQTHPHVVTESVGEGENRKVVIAPKRSG